MLTKRLPTLLAAVVLITAIPAFAYTISQSQVFTGTTNISGSLTYNQFDTHGDLWDLQSIKLSFTLQTSGGHLEIYNNDPSPASITFQFGTNGLLASTDVFLPDMSLQVYDGNHIELPNLGDSYAYDGGIKTDTKLVSIDESFWDEFLGTGTYTINYAIAQWINWSGTGFVGLDALPPSTSSIVTVLYTYNVVPEPATICILGLGVGGLVLRRKHNL
jgi:hypothetical protein